MFRDRVEDLKDRYLDRCRVLHVLSREPRDTALLNGRVDAGKITALVEAGLITPARLSAAYLCGPDSMMTDCRDALAAAGMDGGRIATEHFTPAVPSAGAPATRRRAAGKADDPPRLMIRRRGTCMVELRADGITRHFAMDPARQTILAAGQAAGVELPYSCEAGMCCTCRCRLVSRRGRYGRELFTRAVGDGGRFHPVMPGAPEDRQRDGGFRRCLISDLLSYVSWLSRDAAAARSPARSGSLPAPSRNGREVPRRGC